MLSKSIWICGLFTFVLLSTTIPAWSQNQVEVVGFSVAKKDSGNEYGQSYVPGTQAGVQVYVRVVLPKNIILKIDSEGSSLHVKDSTDQALAANENFDISFYSSISDDKHAAILPVQCSELPSAGATYLMVSGEATLNCGADAKTETVDVSITEGGELKLGPVTAKVTQLGDGFQEGSKRVELESKNSFDAFASIVFLDAADKEMETSSAGSGSFGFGGDMTYSQSYQIAGDVAKIAKAKVTYFQKIEAVKIPVEAKVGLDLGK